MTTAPTTDRAALVRAIAAQHLAERGPLMPVLHEVMEELGHVAREDVETIADVLNLSVAEVHGVVSFYHDFRTEPPAAHTVALCRGEACQSVGAEALYDDTRARAGRLGAGVEVGRGLLPRQLRARAVRHSGRPPPRPAVGRAARRAHGGVALTAPTGRVFVPADAAAVSVGADEVAAAFEAAGAQVVRNGSRGMLWLEPLVEVETDAGRVGFGNVAPEDVPAWSRWSRESRRATSSTTGCDRGGRRAPLADLAAAGELRPRRRGRPDVDRRLRGARRLGRAAPGAVALPRRGGPGGHRLRAPRPRRRRLPGRHQVEDRPGGRVRPEVRGLQLRRGRLRDVRRPDGRRGRPVHPHRGHDDRRPRRRGERGLRLRALRVPPRRRRPAPRDRRGVHPRLPRPGRPRLGPRLRPARARRRGRLHLRRGVLDAREPRGPPRRGAGQAADPRASRASGAGRPRSTTC